MVEHVNNRLLKSVVALIIFWPVGVFALWQAIKVNNLAAEGRIAEAKAAASTANTLSNIVIWITVASLGLAALIGACIAILAASVT